MTHPHARKRAADCTGGILFTTVIKRRGGNEWPAAANAQGREVMHQKGAASISISFVLPWCVVKT